MKKIEHNEHCKQIAETLKKYVDGTITRCPMCGTEFQDGTSECTECGEETEIQSIYDFFTDIYNTKFRVSSKDADEVESVSFMVAYGGPNIYIDTAERKVLLYWWTESGEAWLDDDVVEAVNEFANELWNC